MRTQTPPLNPVKQQIKSLKVQFKPQIVQQTLSQNKKPARMQPAPIRTQQATQAQLVRQMWRAATTVRIAQATTN